MTKQDAMQIFFILKTAYPKHYQSMKKDEIDNFTDLWASIFEDKPAELVGNGLKAYIATNKSGFPPDPGAVNIKIMALYEPEPMTELEAWQLINKAVSNCGYRVKEEFDKLPIMLQRLVGSPRVLYDWSMMNISEFQTVIQSHFVRSYREIAERNKEQSLIPSNIREKSKELPEQYAEKTLKLHD